MEQQARRVEDIQRANDNRAAAHALFQLCGFFAPGSEAAVQYGLTQSWVFPLDDGRLLYVIDGSPMKFATRHSGRSVGVLYKSVSLQLQPTHFHNAITAALKEVLRDTRRKGEGGVEASA